MLQALAQAVDFKVGRYFGEGQLPDRPQETDCKKGEIIGRVDCGIVGNPKATANFENAACDQAARRVSSSLKGTTKPLNNSDGCRLRNQSD
jgi:hypothetical protein